MTVSGNIYAQTPPSSDGRHSRPIPYYRVPHPNQFSLKRFSSPDNLKLAWRELRATGGHAPGSDDLTFGDYSPGQMFTVLRAVETALRERTYWPRPIRTVEIAKDDGGVRELSIQCIHDRVVAKCLQACLDNYWRQQLPNLGRSVLGVYVAMEQTIRNHQLFFLQVEDIANCFPSTYLGKVIECQHRHFNNADLLWLTERIIRGHEGRNDTTGIGQGSPYSPVAVESFLHNFDTELDATYQGTCHLFRYVDNFNILVSSMSQGDNLRQWTNQLLDEMGFQLKDSGTCIDLRDPGHTTSILGLIPTWQSGHLSFAIHEKSYKTLKKAVHEALVRNYPNKRIKSVVHGWLRASGPALTGNKRNEVVDRVLSACRGLDLHFQKCRLIAISQTARNDWLRRCSNV